LTKTYYDNGATGSKKQFFLGLSISQRVQKEILVCLFLRVLVTVRLARPSVVCLATVARETIINLHQNAFSSRCFLLVLLSPSLHDGTMKEEVMEALKEIE
jgi:hypothetical protein